MKKIVFLENAVNYGGAKIATIYQAYQIPEYSKNEFQTIIVDINGSCKPFVEACIKNNIELKIVNDGGQPKILRSNRKIKTWINRLLFVSEFIKTRRKVQRIVSELKPDYIFVNTERSLSFLYGYKGSGVVVFFAHFWYLNSQITKSNRFLFKKIVDRYICVSEATRQALYNNGIAPLDKIFVAHNSIDQTLTNVQPAVIPGSEGCFKILHCGGFTKGKGQHISLEIAKKLKDRGFRFKMIFTGIIYAGEESQCYYNSLLSKVEKYHLEEDVVFIVGHSNVYDYMQATDILIHPSATEGFPLVVMEAQIMHKPVVANGVGGIIDLIHDGYTGFIANYNDFENYVQLIMKLQKDKVLYDFIAENAYNFASHSLTVKQQIDKIIAALKY